jgi:hypothetical protein
MVYASVSRSLFLVYRSLLTLVLFIGCATNITSPTSFSISCDHTVHMHGIWLLVTGSSRKDLSVWGGKGGGAYYDYAGVQYSYEVGQSASSAGVRFPGEEEVFNVMGTGQSLRGTHWYSYLNVLSLITLCGKWNFSP